MTPERWKQIDELAQSALDHPHICGVYEVGEEAGYSFIVMQYVEGETLASRIQRQRIEFREALDIAVQIAEALAEAHSHRIIHRDVKPQNVMLTASGQVKVLDFGLARVAHEGSLIDSKRESESLRLRQDSPRRMQRDTLSRVTAVKHVKTPRRL